ncbi:NUDIX domain-containing protein [Magnetofaba australis]|uniref:Putative NUDIX hydrolase n=1 Tax=Magnetofaba australis IT-1 TaxID=1434232 RepID=A0A1Y2K2B1_9PROT|nr:NUDIX hydrolase [Magnetofaba australis]OSM02089.1 putative NUDIX hydrolase [Magnetofaba australis IT-1]
MIIRPCGVLVEAGRLLAMRYEYGGQERFNLPGGNLEAGEEARDCLEREFLEELGLRVEVGALLATLQTNANGRDVLHMVFAVTAQGPIEPHLNPQETSALGWLWMDAESLADAAFYPATPADLLQLWALQKSGAVDHLGLIHQPWL